MSYHYNKLEGMKNNGNEVYYKTPINVNIHKSTIFNDKYIYYFETGIEYKLLGKYLGKGKINMGNYCNDIDYEAYIFENEKILCHYDKSIHCCGVPDTDENMTLIKDITYNDCELYYKEN
jgi:hypothetical protein